MSSASINFTIPADAAASWLNEQNETHTHAKPSSFDGQAFIMVEQLTRLKLSMLAEKLQQVKSAGERLLRYFAPCISCAVH